MNDLAPNKGGGGGGGRGGEGTQARIGGSEEKSRSREE